MTQPSQIRYIHYFYQLLKNPYLSPTLTYIDKITMYGVPKFNSGGSCKPYIDIISMKTLEKVYSGKKSHAEQAVFIEKETFNSEKERVANVFEIKVEKPVPIYGDVLVKMKNNGKLYAYFFINNNFHFRKFS